MVCYEPSQLDSRFVMWLVASTCTVQGATEKNLTTDQFWSKGYQLFHKFNVSYVKLVKHLTSYGMM